MIFKVKSIKRAVRRSRNQRKKKRAQSVYVIMGYSDPQMQEWAKRNYNHLKACSCWMCGNYRKNFGGTFQEKKTLLALKYDGLKDD
jgi:hypothetical protein